MRAKKTFRECQLSDETCLAKRVQMAKNHCEMLEFMFAFVTFIFLLQYLKFHRERIYILRKFSNFIKYQI